MCVGILNTVSIFSIITQPYHFHYFVTLFIAGNECAESGFECAEYDHWLQLVLVTLTMCKILSRNDSPLLFWLWMWWNSRKETIYGILWNLCDFWHSWSMFNVRLLMYWYHKISDPPYCRRTIWWSLVCSNHNSSLILKQWHH